MQRVHRISSHPFRSHPVARVGWGRPHVARLPVSQRHHPAGHLPRGLRRLWRLGQRGTRWLVWRFRRLAEPARGRERLHRPEPTPSVSKPTVRGAIVRGPAARSSPARLRPEAPRAGGTSTVPRSGRNVAHRATPPRPPCPGRRPRPTGGPPAQAARGPPRWCRRSGSSSTRDNDRRRCRGGRAPTSPAAVCARARAGTPSHHDATSSTRTGVVPSAAGTSSS
jgi:hypothetical protein